MAWVGIAHRERLVRFNHRLRKADVVVINITGQREAARPSDVRLLLHIKRYSRYAQLNFGVCARRINGNAIDKCAPRCGNAHANGVLTLFLCIKLKERGVNIEIVAGLSLSHLVWHLEDELTICSTSVEREHATFEVNGFLGLNIAATSDGHLTHIEVHAGSIFELQGNKSQFFPVEIVINSKGLGYPFVCVGQFGLGTQRVIVLGDFATFGSEHHVYIGSTLLHLIFQGDNITLLQIESGFEELQVLLICRAIYAHG